MIEADICEGCGVRDQGDNFSHEGLCKRCNETIMGMPQDDLLKATSGDGKLMGDVLGANSQVKSGSFKCWKDDVEEVEIRLPLPKGTTKKSLRIDLNQTACTLHVTHAALLDGKLAERELLAVEPLFDKVRGGEGLVWYLEGPDVGDPETLVLQIEKVRGSAWGTTLCKDPGGALRCWEGALT